MFQKPCLRDQDQKPNIRAIDAPSTLVTEEVTRVLGALRWELGAETSTYISNYFTVALL